MTIGETFFLSRYMHRKVNSRPARPGTREFRLSCIVVTLTGSRAMPEVYCMKALLMPSPPSGRLSQSMNAPSERVTLETTKGKPTLTQR